MREQSETLREAVGVFANANDLQAAIGELLSSSFHRAELSLLAGEDALNEHLGGLADVRSLDDDHAVPRSAYVSPEAIADAQGGIVSLLRMRVRPLLHALSSCRAAQSSRRWLRRRWSEELEALLARRPRGCEPGM